MKDQFLKINDKSYNVEDLSEINTFAIGEQEVKVKHSSNLKYNIIEDSHEIKDIDVKRKKIIVNQQVDYNVFKLEEHKLNRISVINENGPNIYFKLDNVELKNVLLKKRKTNKKIIDNLTETITPTNEMEIRLFSELEVYELRNTYKLVLKKIADSNRYKNVIYMTDEDKEYYIYMHDGVDEKQLNEYTISIPKKLFNIKSLRVEVLMVPEYGNIYRNYCELNNFTKQKFVNADLKVLPKTYPYNNLLVENKNDLVSEVEIFDSAFKKKIIEVAPNSQKEIRDLSQNEYSFYRVPANVDCIKYGTKHKKSILDLLDK